MTGERLILTLLAQIALILALTRVMGWIFSRFRQPAVLGEMIAGIFLGPSLLGWAFPQIDGRLFPHETLPLLMVLAQIAAVFFLFLIALELDPWPARSRWKSSGAMTIWTIVFSFGLGFLITLAFFDWRIALFVATALTATSFPLLGRILTDRNLHGSSIALTSMACAAFSNLAAWCILAIVIVTAGDWVRVAVGGAIYLATMVFLVRPFLSRLVLIHEYRGKLGHNVLAAILFLIIASSFATQWIGLHALFGALVLGLIVPRERKFVRHLTEKLQDLVLVFMLPLFFAYIGVNTHLEALSAMHWWVISLLLLGVACGGKIGGTLLAGRLSNVPWRESAAVGILLNTRGLMMLLILSVGMQFRLIPEGLFAVMVVVALCTTALTTPLLNWLHPPRLIASAQASQSAEFSILIPISLPKSGGPLVQIADALIGPARLMGKLFALHLRRPIDHGTFHAADAEIESEAALTPLLSQAQARALAVEPIAFVSDDISADISHTAAGRHVNLVLMGYHNPIFGKAMLGGTVHRVLTSCPTHVAVFVDRGLRNIDRILVPYLGSAHDTLAMELAARIVRNTSAQATILHVVPPMTPSAPKSAEAKRTMEKIFDSPAACASVGFQVVEDSSPVGVVLHQARDYDLVIIGVAEEWGLESRLFGWRPEKIARDCPASLLIVRSFGKTQNFPASAILQQSAATPTPGVAL
jgi:Kef-type K+ transport system membrane component KefB